MLVFAAYTLYMAPALDKSRDQTAHDKSGWNINKFLRVIYFLFWIFHSEGQFAHTIRGRPFDIVFCQVDRKKIEVK